jgi:hypothetical protein
MVRNSFGTVATSTVRGTVRRTVRDCQELFVNCQERFWTVRNGSGLFGSEEGSWCDGSWTIGCSATDQGDRGHKVVRDGVELLGTVTGTV